MYWCRRSFLNFIAVTVTVADVDIDVEVDIWLVGWLVGWTTLVIKGCFS